MYSGWCTKGWLEYIEYLESRLEVSDEWLLRWRRLTVD
jgi:hypothetical protein